MVHLSSPHTVTETLARLETIVQTKGLAIVARIDHSGDAAKAGLKMQPTKLLIFGNAKSGTPLMIASPSVAIDLPLKALVWQDDDGKVWLSYNSPDYLKERHAIPENLLQNIAGIGPICAEAVRYGQSVVVVTQDSCSVQTISALFRSASGVVLRMDASSSSTM
jgi:uncharacterized protein (DUF302 family)